MTHKNRLLLNRVTVDDRFEKTWFSNGSVWGLLKDVNKTVGVNFYQSCDDAIKDAERFEPRNQQLHGNPGKADLRHPNSYNAFRPRTPQQRPNNPIPIERRLGNIAGMTMTHNFPLFASTHRQIDTQQHVGRTATQITLLRFFHPLNLLRRCLLPLVSFNSSSNRYSTTRWWNCHSK